MGIEGISSAVGGLNVSPAKTARPVSSDVTVSAVSSTAQIKNDKVAPVFTDSKSGYSGNMSGQDQAGVQSDKEISPEKVKSAVDDINKQIKSNLRNTQCSFKYHEDTNRISITVTDKETDEVIREIPPEKALDMLAKAWELAGLMVDERR